MRARVCGGVRDDTFFFLSEKGAFRVCSQIPFFTRRKKKKIFSHAHHYLLLQKFRAQFSPLRPRMCATPNEQTCKKPPRV